jgi:DNA-directed RNA polymerase specialized sigma24 family protein
MRDLLMSILTEANNNSRLLACKACTHHNTTHDNPHGMTDSEFASRCNAHWDYLLRAAALQLRANALTENAVQDTLVAALQGTGASWGWLTGILKHKIVDAIRRMGREPVQASLDEP